MNMAKNRTQTTTTKLTVHGLLGSISYWGTTARFVFVSILIGFAFILNLSGSSVSQYIDTEIIFLILGLGSLLMLDLGYVVAARALPLKKMIDRWVIMMSDLLLAAFFVIPSIVIISVDGNKLRIVGFVSALLVIALRALVGLLFAKRR